MTDREISLPTSALGSASSGRQAQAQAEKQAVAAEAQALNEAGPGSHRTEVATEVWAMTGIERVLSALEEHGRAPRHTGIGQWEALCPSHDDRNPSLGISDAEGKTLLHCLAGCDTLDVLVALELRLSDLFDDEPPKQTIQRTIAATHRYTDENGALLFEVVRYQPKDFRARRPNGKGGWIWNLSGVRRVPYRLAGLVEAVGRGDTIWILEGEKDADAIAEQGETATCSPGGAGKWRR